MLNNYDVERIGEISEIIRAEGFEIGNFEGVKLPNIRESCIGILAPKSLDMKKFHKSLKFSIRLKSDYIANLWLNDKQELQDYSGKWTLEIYGRENYNKLDDILRTLQNKYYVRIIKNIASEKAEKEFDDGLIL